VVTRGVLRKESAFTELAFVRLLEWLDDGVESQGERYLEIRRRLVAYFDRRNRPCADELADETLTRVARTLESEAVAIRPPARYCYVVARFVLLEDVRRGRKHVPLDEPSAPKAWARHATVLGPDDGNAVREQRLDCLDRCLLELTPDRRELVVDYYRKTARQKIENRRALANRLGITVNALSDRVCRLRDALMACVERCRGERHVQPGRP
jgi:DNA-directed RNA polymerase specialized sigma24 family protein